MEPSTLSSPFQYFNSIHIHTPTMRLRLIISLFLPRPKTEYGKKCYSNTMELESGIAYPIQPFRAHYSALRDYIRTRRLHRRSIAIQLNTVCLTAHAIFSPKFWNDKTNFTRVFVTVSPQRPWDRG